MMSIVMIVMAIIVTMMIVLAHMRKQ